MQFYEVLGWFWACFSRFLTQFRAVWVHLGPRFLISVSWPFSTVFAFWPCFVQRLAQFVFCTFGTFALLWGSRWFCELVFERFWATLASFLGDFGILLASFWHHVEVFWSRFDHMLGHVIADAAARLHRGEEGLGRGPLLLENPNFPLYTLYIYIYGKYTI